MKNFKIIENLLLFIFCIFIISGCNKRYCRQYNTYPNNYYQNDNNDNNDNNYIYDYVERKNIIDDIKIEKPKEYVTTIYFENNSFTLSKEDIKTIKEIVAYDDITNYYTINGYSSLSGSYQYNYDLALKRAEKIKEKLVEYGINTNRINVNSMVSEYSLEDSNNSGRAEIYID